MTYADVLEDHYARNWASLLHRIRLDKGRVDELPDDFVVVVMAVGLGNPITALTWAVSRF